jgi:PAS domain S-box-containing protein
MKDAYKTKKELVRELAEIREKIAGQIGSENPIDQTVERTLCLGRILEESLNEIYIFHADTLRFLEVNKGARINLGYSIDELESFTPIDINPGFTKESFTKLIEPLRTKKKEKIEYVAVHRRRDGSLYPAEVHLQTTNFEGMPAFVAIVLDITERRQAEERFRLVVESSPASIVMVDKEGKINLVNSQTEKSFGYNRVELMGQTVEILVPERFRNEHIEYRKRFAMSPTSRPMGEGRDLYALRKDGTEFPVEIGLSIIHSAEGAMILSSIIDISTRKLAEEELSREREKAQKYLDVAEVMLVAINEDEEITMINKNGCTLLGCDENEIIGRNWFDNFIPASARKDTRRVFRKLLRGELGPLEFHENKIINKAGEEKLIAWHNSLLKDDRDMIVGTLSSGVDMTEQKKSEQILRESEEKLKAIMDNTPDEVLVYNEQGQILILSKAARRLFSDKEGNEPKIVWEIIPPENRYKFDQILKTVKQGNNLLDYEMEKVLANGERIAVSVALSYMKSDVGMFFETIRDASERVKMRNKIIELEKTQFVGKMAEGVAHHMGTPLASMLLRVQMLKEDLSGLRKYRGIMEKLESIERQIFYGQKIMQRLLKFASKPENEKRPEKISSIIEEAFEIVKPLCKKTGIKLDLSIEDDPWLLADVDLMELVFSDMLMNSIDAMPEGGTISLKVTNDFRENFINITITDTGGGIPKDILPLIFEPFFSTKPSGKGTGLGLSVAKRILQDHGGEISIESTEATGTSVHIKIPPYSKEMIN